MIRISDIKLPVGHSEAALLKKAAGELRVREDRIREIRTVRRSLDARRKPDLYYIYTVDVELAGQMRSAGGKQRNISQTPDERFHMPVGGRELLSERPVIVGCGPAGLFAGYLLALAGYRPLIIDRGDPAEVRARKVEDFWKGGSLDTESNVQFGEGGAGTFSDGKLNTSVKDPGYRARFIKETFVKHGASPDILTDQKPHVGTDVLVPVLISMRKAIEEMGGEYRFRTRFEGYREAGGRLTGIYVNGGELIPANVCVLAPGHSARDTFFVLAELALPMEAKPFACGVRIEHPQAMIDLSQYGRARGALPPAAYKLTHQAADGRGVYSFCMCPGGYVVNASSEAGMLAVNGMSYSGRGSENANSALIVSVNPRDYTAEDWKGPAALAGIPFQRKLEALAWRAGEGRIPQQLFADFRQGTASSGPGGFVSVNRGGGKFGRVDDILPDFMTRDIVEGVEAFGRRIEGFDRADAIISGTESRSSSPVRILRDSRYVSAVDGLFPCGEGAGYAGGIISAAMDGMRVAEAISKRFQKLSPVMYTDANLCYDAI